MLQFLRIKNLALLESLELEFAPGFTAVTGETGAGKSILLGALTLLAGGRADKSVIRQGETSCEIEAALFFEKPKAINATLAAHELPECEDGQLLLKRILHREKPPKITINGALATLAALQEIGDAWIDFHGPGEPRRLLKPNCQLDLLDLFSSNAAALEKYATHFRAWRTTVAEITRIANDTRLSPAQIEFLQQEINKLADIDLSSDAIAALERDHARLSRAQELIATAQSITGGLAGDGSVLNTLSPLVRAAQHLERLDPASKTLADRLAALAIEAEDIARDFETLSESFVFDPEQAAELEEKMATWLSAKRRHGGTPESVATALAEMRHRVATQSDIEGTLARLEQEAEAAKKSALAAALTLRESREKAARTLAKEAAKRIAELGFKRAEFSIQLTTLPELAASGDCSCEFLFSPNVGEAQLPLHKIASSGELARVMLALKTILADVDHVPLLVFDEVDANVGGEIGRTVGERMADLSAQHQVLCVTHLPQVAALAHNHLVVEKDQSGERASVSITPIHDTKKLRLEELARMLGDRTAKSALKHAEELMRGN